MIKMKMLRKLLLSIFLGFFLLTAVFVPSAKAQDEPGPWYNQTFEQWAVKVFDPDNPQEIFGERYTYAQVTWITHSLKAIGMGEELLACMQFRYDVAGEFKDCIEAIETVSAGPIPALAVTGDVILNTPAASGIGYLANAASKLHIIPEAHAQGVGFEGLEALQIAWKIARNAAYFLLIIATVVMAFMIMFRAKISPQVVITVQSALPRLIIILVLVTFSYAIAGLVIDFAYMIVGMLAALIKTVGVDITDLGAYELFNRLMFRSLFGAFVFTMLVYVTIVAIVAAAIAIIVGTVGSGGIGWPVAIMGGAIGGLIILIFLIVMLIASFRLWWLLLKTTINIVLLVIAAPIMILLGVVPAAGGFGSWLKNLASNIAVFPAVKMMLFLCHFFFFAMLAGDGNWMGGNETFNPLLIKSFEELGGGAPSVFMPGFSPGSQGFIGWILSLGIFLMIPSIGNMIKSAIEGRPFGYGAAIGQAFGPVAWAGQSAWRSPTASGVREVIGRQSAAGLTGRFSTWYPEAWPGKETIRKVATGARERAVTTPQTPREPPAIT